MLHYRLATMQLGWGGAVIEVAVGAWSVTHQFGPSSPAPRPPLPQLPHEVCARHQTPLLHKRLEGSSCRICYEPAQYVNPFQFENWLEQH